MCHTSIDNMEEVQPLIPTVSLSGEGDRFNWKHETYELFKLAWPTVSKV